MPYCPNQFLGWDFSFTVSYRQPALAFEGSLDKKCKNAGVCTGGRRSSSAENVRGIPHEMCQLAIRTQLGKIGDHYFGPFPLIHTVYNSKCFSFRFPSVCTGVLCLMFFGVSSLQVGRSKISQLPPAIGKMEKRFFYSLRKIGIIFSNLFPSISGCS